MSLKLFSLTPTISTGECDGRPFQAEIQGDRFVARIGADPQVWTIERHDPAIAGDIDHTGTIRGLIYAALARYRESQRGLAVAS